jgi:hypothetical protein
LWTPASSKALWLVLSFLLTFSASSAQASVINKQLHFEWKYDLSIADVAGFKIYQNGQSLFTVNDGTTLTLDLEVALESDQDNTFTMTAFDVGGEESAQSVSYIIDLNGNIVTTAKSAFKIFPNAAISLLLLKK